MLNGKSWSVTAILLTLNCIKSVRSRCYIRGLFNNHVSLVSLDWGKHCKKSRLFTRNPWRDVTREWFRQLINQPWGSLPRTSEGWPGWIYVRVWCLLADLTGNWKMRAHIGTRTHTNGSKYQQFRLAYLCYAFCLRDFMLQLSSRQPLPGWLAGIIIVSSAEHQRKGQVKTINQTSFVCIYDYIMKNIILYNIILYYIIWYKIIWYNIIWYDMI